MGAHRSGLKAPTFVCCCAQDIFSTLGTVTEVRILKDKASGISQGSAFVKFQDHQAAALAIQNINGRVLYSKVASVVVWPMTCSSSICNYLRCE